MQCKHCNERLSEGTKMCPNCGKPFLEGQRYAPGAGLYVDLPDLPMNWFGFLINVFLFAAALLFTCNGIIMVMGEMYDIFGSTSSEVIYADYPAMQYVDIALGCSMFICSLLALVTRFRLAGFSKDGPMLLNVIFLLNSIISICRITSMYLILPEEIFNTVDITSTLVAFVISMVMMAVNTAYFKRRSAFFGS